MPSREMRCNNAVDSDGKSVLYVMSRDQRVKDNHTLLLAQKKAIELKLPLVVGFILFPSSGERSYEHFSFMLDGLKEVSDSLESLEISFVMRPGAPRSTLEKLVNDLEPVSIYFDFSPLLGPRSIVKSLAKSTNIPCTVVDTHNVIPVWHASDKREYAAHTFRHKVHKQLEKWIVEPDELRKHPYASHGTIDSMSFTDAYERIKNIKKSGISINHKSGESAANQALTGFISSGLEHYALDRNDIAIDKQSNLSPYLHFGQLSALRVALEVMYAVDREPLLFSKAKMASTETNSKEAGMNALFEEMIVRKELSDNFCLFSENYMTIDAAESWSKQTHKEHSDDPREHIYTKKQLEEGGTHDEIWNAAQHELTSTGKIHGYMRMYWAKKILEWTSTPEYAVQIAIYLNDKYSIDGGDPNGYVGVLWSIAGIHDRPWTEREVFGKIRYMNAAGLRRKYDVDAYIKRVNR